MEEQKSTDNKSTPVVDSIFKSFFSGLDEKTVISMLSYIPFLCIVLYIIKDKDETVQFHARQGIVIFVISVFGIIPVIGAIPFVISLVLMLIGMSKAYKREKYKIPYIYKYAQRINI